MTKRATFVLHSPLIAETANGNSRDFPEVNNFNRFLIYLTVTAMSGTSQTLNLDIQYKDPSTFGATAQYVNVQSRIVGINANGAQTTGGYALGPFDQVNNTTALPWTEARAITVTEMAPSILRANWRLGGTNPSFTFGVVLIAESEE